MRGLHAGGVTTARWNQWRGRRERAKDRDAKSFRDRDAVAFNGLYVICELGVGVARRAKKLKVLQCLLCPCCCSSSSSGCLCLLCCCSDPLIKRRRAAKLANDETRRDGAGANCAAIAEIKRAKSGQTCHRRQTGDKRETQSTPDNMQHAAPQMVKTLTNLFCNLLLYMVRNAAQQHGHWGIVVVVGETALVRQAGLAWLG